MPFEAVGDLDLVALEERLLRSWADEDLFAESLGRREGAPEWVFYEGPPTANGRPALHHAWARCFKDLYPRFHTMRGRHVARKGGWDCHGLPVELEVEKELGIASKHEIEDLGIAEFNRRCRESVQRYVEDWSALTTRIGMWLDVGNAYWTLSNDYIESVWWLFHQMWEHGDIYEGYKVVPYCGRCGTALSSHEVALGYEDITEPSVYVRFPVVDADYDLLVWTTTPWTLVSNVACAVGPDIEYVRVRAPEGGRDLVMAAARVAPLFGADADVVSPVPVRDLLGRHYQRPFEFLPVDDALRVVADDFVTIEDGSGIVHLAPAFGEVDREIGEREGLPILNPVDASARIDRSVPPYAGQSVKDADPGLIEDLRDRGLLVAVVEYTHSYPHCWRCSTPLIYWAKPTWFARTSAHRDEMLRENETIGWHPEHIKYGRFGEWLRNNVDWALSRDRYWGTPLPIWHCDTCGHDACVGSVAELSELAGQSVAGIDLHRPDVDEVAIVCPECGGRARRIEAVLDAWFDSGSMPSAQFHFPFENREVFERRFPADFISEAIDQTRGWFYSLLAVNTLVFGRSPYRNVVCLSLLVDKDAQKMSKSRGNTIDPWSILKTRGADALRWHFFSAGSPWTNRRISDEGIDESTNRFLVKLWNTYSFFITYANLDHWEPSTPVAAMGAETGRSALDRWARSRLHSTVKEVTAALEAFDALRGAQALDSFVDDLSNWYVRRSRTRFWKANDSSAYATLHECLRTVSLLLAPFCPFVSDAMFRNLTGTGESVHLADWPTVDEDAIDASLEGAMATARQITTLGRAARDEAHLRVRLPLRRALVLAPGDPMPPEIVEIVADELNVKEVAPVADLEGLLDERAVPNFPRMGPKVGKLTPLVKEALNAVDGRAVRQGFNETGVFRLELSNGDHVVLEPDDVELRATAHEELALVQDGAVAVAIDVRIDEELRLEGIARDLIHMLNNHRKAIGLELTDRIHVRLRCGGPALAAARQHQAWIAEEVLAVSFEVRNGEERVEPP
ncbi:MAG: isoleucine--tRNA ligase, partial [Actinobacteria bacterium]